MDGNVFLFGAVAYVFVYTAIARRLVQNVLRIEGAEFFGGNVPASLGFKHSRATLLVLRDERLPRDDYPPTVRRLIKVARVMLYSAPVVLGVCIIAAVLA
jgi:hypothetical protein